MEKPRTVPVGKIVKAHGLKGVVKVYSDDGPAAVFAADRQVVAVDTDGGERPLTVDWAQPGDRHLRVAFSGVDTREQARMLVGCELFMDADSLPALEEGTYYWSEIVGLAVYGKDDTYIGRVASIIATGGNDVYVVKDGKTETLVPALDWVVLSVDPAKGTMRVDLPEGL